MSEAPTSDRNSGPVRWLADQILSFFQKRCEHPSDMVAVDILEGCSPGLAVSYCNRCGAVKTDWRPGVQAVAIDGPSSYSAIDHTWRRPDPNLWRGM